MRPVVTPAEMAAIDAQAPEPVEELIARAAWAVAVEAIDLLGRSPYGKRVAVLAGKGNNGADGRLAVPHLERRGARCSVFDFPGTRAPGSGRGAGPFDLVIDACVGTGLGRDFDAAALPIAVGDTPVLAVDIPSGVDGLTGRPRGNPLPATATVTFAAPKPGLLLPPGRHLAGRLVVADIGLDCSPADMHVVGPDDVVARWPRRSADAHKWRGAVHVIGGSPGMTGAPRLASTAALRAGASYVAQTIPGEAIPSIGPIEAVHVPAPADWAASVLAGLDRFGAAVIGPGLPDDRSGQTDQHGRSQQGEQVARYLEATSTPTVIDAGALSSMAGRLEQGWKPRGPHVATPHDGEFARLAGDHPGPDRVAATRALARRLDLVVLLKGSTTVVAAPDGRVLLSISGDQRLATAGTGDVLSGVIAAAMAGGLMPFEAAALGAQVHGMAAARCNRVGMTAGDLPPALSAVLSDLLPGGPDDHDSVGPVR